MVDVTDPGDVYVDLFEFTDVSAFTFTLLAGVTVPSGGRSLGENMNTIKVLQRGSSRTSITVYSNCFE